MVARPRTAPVRWSAEAPQLIRVGHQINALHAVVHQVQDERGYHAIVGADDHPWATVRVPPAQDAPRGRRRWAAAPAPTARDNHATRRCLGIVFAYEAPGPGAGAREEQPIPVGGRTCGRESFIPAEAQNPLPSDPRLFPVRSPVTLAVSMLALTVVTGCTQVQSTDAPAPEPTPARSAATAAVPTAAPLPAVTQATPPAVAADSSSSPVSLLHRQAPASRSFPSNPKYATSHASSSRNRDVFDDAIGTTRAVTGSITTVGPVQLRGRVDRLVVDLTKLQSDQRSRGIAI